MSEKDLLDMDVSRETINNLKQFAKLVENWGKSINLVSKHSLPHIWQRHISDSAQIAKMIKPQKNWVDLGSGGGFPALVLAILFKEKSPETRITMIESDQRKAAFLLSCSQKLCLNTRVIQKRIEKSEQQNAQVISARALADLSTLIGYAQYHLSPNGKCLFLKGKSYKKEIEIARKEWFFNCKIWPSITNEESAILEIWGISKRV